MKTIIYIGSPHEVMSSFLITPFIESSINLQVTTSHSSLGTSFSFPRTWVKPLKVTINLTSPGKTSQSPHEIKNTQLQNSIYLSHRRVEIAHTGFTSHNEGYTMVSLNPISFSNKMNMKI